MLRTGARYLSLSLYVYFDLLSVAVLIHTVEEDSAFAMPAAGFGKLCPSASLVIMSCGRPYAAKSFLQRHLEVHWSVLEPCGGVSEALGRSLRHLGAVLDASWGLLGAMVVAS